MTTPRIFNLNTDDAQRLSKWLDLFDVPPAGINRGRYFSMQYGTSWITADELLILSDAFPPYDAVGVIRGTVAIREAREEVVIAT